MNNLGNVYDSQGRWEDALKCYEQSLEVFRELGDRHGVGLTLGNLGLLCHARNCPDKAKEVWTESLAYMHPNSPERQQLQQLLGDLENPSRLSNKKRIFRYLLWVAVAAFIVINLLRGHWLIAALSLLIGLGIIVVLKLTKTHPPA